ncbi:MAG: phenylacetate--CoA ligase [Euryarchaeota archaeon]|nr:phenylacetate--CoA ligase [Euryarchaeota archaeon]
MSILQRVKLTLARRKLSSQKIASGSGDALEVWAENKIRTEFKRSPELRESIGRKRLGTISRSDMREFQLHRFRQQMKYVMENSYYYKKKFEAAGIRPEDIQTWDDLQKVPLTEPADLAAEPMTFICVSQSKVMRIFSTSGTTGMRKRLSYTQDDVLNIIDSISAALKTVGLTEKDTLQIMFPAVAAWDPGLMLDGACKVAGMRSVISSTADVDEQIQTMKAHETNMMIGLTSFLYRVTILAKDRYDLSSFGMKAIICSAEPLSEAMRQEMISSWGCPVLAQYGMTEMGLATSIECDQYDGLHLNDADFLVECIDPETEEHVPDGQPGELVFTSLSMKGSPLLRYRSYDLSFTMEPPCGCGFKTLGKIGKVQGRLDAQTKIGYGQKIYPLLFDEAILPISGVISYTLQLNREDFRDRLLFIIEYEGDPESIKTEVLDVLNDINELQEALKNDLIFPPEVELVPNGSVEFSPKSKTIVDNRENYDEVRV